MREIFNPELFCFKVQFLQNWLV